jgi:superfamily II DNA or RNA helicase
MRFSLAVQGSYEATETPIVSEDRPLRPYQKDAADAVCERLATEQSTMLVLATGLGKSRTVAEVIRRKPGRWLCLAHMDNLVEQLKVSLERDLGQRFELEQGEWKADPFSHRHVIASVQSLMREERLERFPPDAFVGIVADEGHHYVSKAFSSPFRRFPNARRVFLTATPDRRDKRGYRGLCDSVAYRMELGDWRDDAGVSHLGAISRHWATPVKVRTFRSEVDLDGISWGQGDFVASQLDTEITKAAAVIAEAVITRAGDMKTAVFTPGVASAHAAADAINEREPGTAVAIDGSMDRERRREIFAAFKAGQFKRLCNCLLLTEGFDAEDLMCMVDAAPTSSRSRAVQKLGRITRLWPGLGHIHDDDARRVAIAASPKPFCYVVDLAFNSKKHDLVGPIDVLGELYDPKVRRLAKKKNEASTSQDVSQILKKAADEIDRRKARAAAAAAAKVSLKEAAPDEPPPKLTSTGERALTPRQEHKLRELGIPYDETTTAVKATKLIRGEYLCRKKGKEDCRVSLAQKCTCGQCWCSYRQREFLAGKVGLRKPWAVKVETGKRLADAWIANGRRQLTQQQIATTIAEGKQHE